MYCDQLIFSKYLWRTLPGSSHSGERTDISSSHSNWCYLLDYRRCTTNFVRKLRCYVEAADNLAHPMKGTRYGAGGIVMALYGALWSYAGWDILNYGAPAVKNPRV